MEVRYNIGWFNIFLIGLSIFINISYLVRNNILDLIWQIKLRKLKRAYKKGLAMKMKGFAL